MTTRYFKTKDERTICSTSSGNRSRAIPAMPFESQKWTEIDKKEFYKLKRRVLKVPSMNQNNDALLSKSSVDDVSEEGRDDYHKSRYMEPS